MKAKLYSLAFAATLWASLQACSSDDAPVTTEKDWNGTTTYFESTDENTFGTYYKPYVGYVGDPMPFYDPQDGDFKVMYLQNYLANDETRYHPIWAVETTNGSSYTSLGELIPTGGDNELDAALGTGCVYYDEANKLYYTYYTGHTTGREVVMRATSTDFETWTKDRTFYLMGDEDGYSASDFRDPCIFADEEGTYHMVISTTKDGSNVLAGYTSTDLKTWTHEGVFMYMHWDRFYECPDIFKMGDWWYLIYSDISTVSRKVCYFKASTLDELKQATASASFPDDKEGFLDTRALYAGKTATDGTTRYLWGWCPYRSGEDNTNVGADPDTPEWSGNLVMHRVVQHTDGTLSLGEVDGISGKYTTESTLTPMVQSGSVSGSSNSYTLNGIAYVLFNRLNVHNKITCTITTSSATDSFGFSFVRGTDSDAYYSIVVNPESATRRKINFEEEGAAGAGFIAGIDGYLFDTPSDNVYDITILTDNSVCVVYVNDNVVYTNRIYGIQKNCWSINSYTDGGGITVSNLKVSYY